jgi:4-hydroxybenzoate polyprenyltransferase
MAVPAAWNPETELEPGVETVAVDLDGTLVATDTAVENLLLVLRRRPWTLFLLPVWLASGRAAFKKRLSQAASIDVTRLPYRPELLAWLRRQKEAGRRLVLATGADEGIAARVDDHLEIFEEVYASDGDTNLVGREKAALLTRKYGRFAYLGDSSADRPVWAASAQALRVDGGGQGLRSWLAQLRVHHWVKNTLVFLPLLTSHRLADGSLLRQAATGFAAFCLTASAAYFLNDLFDLEADRGHDTKRRRPLASGALSPAAGILGALLCAAGAVALSLLLPVEARWLLGGYFVLALAYSLGAKALVFFDVVLLVVFYLLRILLGGMVTGVRVSIWLLAFSMFLFLSLALLKRLTELRVAASPNRGYRTSDAGLVAALAGGAGYLAALLLALYIHSPEAALLYRRTDFLWPICLVLVYWVSRAALLANRGEMPEDPVVFAFTDKASLLCGAAVLGLVFLGR